jgi:NAD(P)-dependent dehydrogenase (short-subunit alcohol dehydrogenase family)
MLRLANKICLVTGSTSGIGRGIAMRFAALGGTVVVTGRNEARGERTVAEIRTMGRDAAFFQADLGSTDACHTLMDFVLDRFDGLDLLVNNAALTTRGTVADTPDDVFDQIVAVNLRAPFILTKRAVAPMRAAGGGCIINVGSVNAYIGEPKLAAYSVSKGGLMTLTRNAASHLGQYRIRVNQLNVGWTLTEGEHKAKQSEGKGSDWLEKAVSTRPFGRLLTPADIAQAAEYFATADCVTGTVMDVEQYPVGAQPDR